MSSGSLRFLLRAVGGVAENEDARGAEVEDAAAAEAARGAEEVEDAAAAGAGNGVIEAADGAEGARGAEEDDEGAVGEAEGGTVMDTLFVNKNTAVTPSKSHVSPSAHFFFSFLTFAR